MRAPGVCQRDAQRYSDEWTPGLSDLATNASLTPGRSVTPSTAVAVSNSRARSQARSIACSANHAPGNRRPRQLTAVPRSEPTCG